MTSPMRRLLIIEREHPADLDLYRATLAAEYPSLQLVTASSAAEALARADGVQAIVAKAQDVPAQLVAHLPRLEWIQALTTGVDPLLALPLPPGLVLTSARGVHGPQMSELALLLMMALLRDLPRMLDNQRRHHWERWPQRLLAGRCVGIVGIGAISEELARRCRVFGMRVIGVSDSRTAAEGFDAVHARRDLARVATEADFLVLLVPYGPDTHHMIDAGVLGAMRRDACLINIARGRVVDEAALIDALRSGQIAGAGLDVFEQEPVPAGNPLWELPNVIMTPHIGGMSDRYAAQLLPLLRHNVGAWLRGVHGELRNVVVR